MDVLKSELDGIKEHLAGIIIEPILGSVEVISIPNEILKYIDKFSAVTSAIFTLVRVVEAFSFMLVFILFRLQKV